MKEKIQGAIKNGVLVEIPKNLIYWCNGYRMVPKTNGGYEDERSQLIYPSETLQNGRNSYLAQDLIWKNNFAISFDVKEVRSIQPCSNLFNILKYNIWELHIHIGECHST
jgi:hypothetical protein